MNLKQIHVHMELREVRINKSRMWQTEKFPDILQFLPHFLQIFAHLALLSMHICVKYEGSNIRSIIHDYKGSLEFMPKEPKNVDLLCECLVFDDASAVRTVTTL